MRQKQSSLLALLCQRIATLMRNQALLEYNEAINKIPKAISDASSSLLSFGDKALSAFSGGYASVPILVIQRAFTKVEYFSYGAG
ncbi:hypothetical protein P5769_000741 [Citrobacter braakii]|nr:hypothetical protein [Citrobacter braakii]